jgi:ribosomal protein L37E
MLIFGIRRKSSITGHITKKCSHCGATCAHTQIESKRFFTLFFIPLIPLGSSHYTTCTSCGQRSSDDAVTPPPPPAVSAVPIEKAPSTTCSVCGESLQSVDDQCAHCGAPIQS